MHINAVDKLLGVGVCVVVGKNDKFVAAVSAHEMLFRDHPA